MKVALVGNQNSGKTTLFNLLTGMNAKVGNWPGVTIEKKTGKIKNTNYEITDLPGIYSLSPYSKEEELSRDFIFKEKIDVIINIIDATSLERSLYLTTQLLELDCKVIIALNMVDILEKKGSIIDEKKLEQILGVKTIKISALKGTGVKELIEEIRKETIKKNTYIYDSNIEQAIIKIESNLKLLESNMLASKIEHKRFIAVKLLENDERFENINSDKIKSIAKDLLLHYDTDLEEIIATERYEFIELVKKKTVIIKQNINNTIQEISISERLDKIFLNKWLAFPIFVFIMFFIYYLSVGVVGNYTIGFIEELTKIFDQNIKKILEMIGTSEWLNSLIIDGMIAGVTSVLSFVPQLIALFTCISILETTGYLSRITLILDKIFHKVGLNGKSLIPFIVGTGCSVSGIMGARIIEKTEERETTAILTPFIPCSAKLPIIALFSGYFFGENSGLISVSLYFLSIIIVIGSAILIKKTIYKNTSDTYILELPEYKLPSMKYIFKDVFDKTYSFIKRAGSVILVCSIIIWFLLSFSFKMEYGVNVEKSILASIGKTISWMFYPMLGTNSWGATVSAIQGLVAKEQVISSMSVISGIIENNGTGSQIFETEIFDFFTCSSAYAFMVFNLFSAPCFGAIAAMRKELGSFKKMIKAIMYQIILAWWMATIIYQVGSRIEDGTLNFSNILLILIIIALVYFGVSQNKNDEEECRKCMNCKECKKIRG